LATSGTLRPSSSNARALSSSSPFSTLPDRFRSFGLKNPSAPRSRYNFTDRFTVISGTPNVRTMSFCFTVPLTIIWLVNIRKL
jgi:hypothetical protein